MKRKISADDEVYLKSEFIESVKDGSITDYDGHGYWSDGKSVSDEIVKPSDILNDKISSKYSHVVWFNN